MVLPALIDLRNSRTVCLIKRLAFNRKYGMPKKDAGLHFCKLKALQKSPKKSPVSMSISRWKLRNGF
ncbi:hypothetical protein PXNS11_360004 [Stutzerimonas xanthomarina]|nr:hypothetical protein PXNS11_360004 [Stutzerimonas xanthomarina]